MEDSGISDAIGQPIPLPDAPSSSEPTHVPSGDSSVPQISASTSSGLSNSGSPMSQSIDDFTHVPSARMISSVSKSQYSQVVFHDVSDLYPTDSDIKCRYTLTSDVSAQPGDKVALFKVGWLSVSEYITFERAPQPSAGETTLAATIKAEKLPKETSNLYQLCYVTSGNVIAGASIPFSFHVPTESELIAVEDPSDPGMVVFRSRVSQLQDELLKKNEDYDQLLLKHTLLEENMTVLKKELDNVDTALKKSQEAVTELFTNKQSLEIDNKVLQERLLQFQQETHSVGKLEEELSRVQKEKNEVDAECQRLKNENMKLMHEYNENKKAMVATKMENLDLVSNMSKNYEMLQEKAHQVETHTSAIKCLQQDCERTTQALKEQVKVVEDLTAHNESLAEKLRTLAAKHNETVMQNIDLNEKLRDAEKAHVDAVKEVNHLKAMMQGLQDAVDAANSSDPSSAHAARATRLEEEKEMLEVMLMTLEEHHAKCADKITNLTTQLGELRLENDRSSDPNRRRSDPNDPASSIFEVVRTVASNFGNLIASPDQAQQCSQGASTSTPDSQGRDEQSVEVVKSKLKLVREQKASVSSELVSVRHNMNQLEKELTELKQDNSSKKNRIEVLEIELRAAKEELTKLKKRKLDEASTTNGHLGPEHVEAFISGLPIINKFNEQVVVLSLLQEKLDAERTENAELKNKVVDLLSKDSELCAELLDMREKFEAASSEVRSLRETPQRETLDMLSLALDNCEKTRQELELKLKQEMEAKAKLEQQVTSLRAECVGKVSVDCSKKMQEHINSLELQVAEQTKFTNYMKKFVHYTFDERANKPISCPLCPTEFPYTCGKKFAAHFKEQHMK